MLQSEDFERWYSISIRKHEAKVLIETANMDSPVDTFLLY